MFRLKDFVSFETKSTYASVRTIGMVFVETPSTQEMVATVDYRFKSCSKGGISTNPVIEYLERHGTALKHQVPLEKLFPVGDPDDIDKWLSALRDL